MSGSQNTAIGVYAFVNNTNGSGNTAIGTSTLVNNTSGSANTASGVLALLNNTSGSANTANGVFALYFNNSGSENTAEGADALYNNSSGSYNTANGEYALYNNNTGSNNIALGYQAGYNIGTGSSNIDIGNMGVATDTNIIRIGSGQSQTFIAGVINVGTGTGTSEAPNAGLVVRRINSTITTSNSVIARSDVLTLIRDGSNGGLMISYPASPGTQTIAAMGITSAGAQVNFYTTLANPGTAGTVQIYSNAQAVHSCQITFGNTYLEGHVTQVSISRALNDNYWVGTVNSTYNQ